MGALQRTWLRFRRACAAFRMAWRDPERALAWVETGEVLPPITPEPTRFRVVRWHGDGREVLVNEGPHGAKARRDYEWSCTLPGVQRVEFWDNGHLRGVWPQER